MHLAFLNPQGNFDPGDSGWTEHPDFGGQLVYVKEVALALGELGHRVDIVTRRFRDDRWPAFEAAEERYPGAPNVRILRLPCGPATFLPKEELWPHLGEWKDAILKRYRAEGGLPDATTGHYADGGLAAVLVRAETGLPFTFTGHSLGAQKIDGMVKSREDLRRVLPRFHYDRRIAAERAAMVAAGRIVVSTTQERLSQYGHRLYGGAVDPQDAAAFAVVPPGVNLRVFGADRRSADEDEVVERVEAAVRRDIPEDRRSLPLVLCSSRLDRKKNHMGLVRAWQESPELRAAANLAIVVRGSNDPLRERHLFSGEQREILDAMAEALDGDDLWPSVTAFELRSQGELAACYRHLAARRRGIFALTALYEPFGLAPLEAMAAGLPAVATREGGPQESLRDDGGEHGVLVDPRDPTDVARGLLRLVRDERAWEAMRRAGMGRVEARYTWARTAEGYVTVLKQLRGDARGSSAEASGPRLFLGPEDDEPGAAWLEDLYFGP